MPFDSLSPLLQGFSSGTSDVRVSPESMLSSNEKVATVSKPLRDLSDSESATQENSNEANFTLVFHRLMDTSLMESTET